MIFILLSSGCIQKDGPSRDYSEYGNQEYKSELTVGKTITITGMVTDYIDDDKVVFTTEGNIWELRLEDSSSNQLPLDETITITIKILEHKDHVFKVELVSIGICFSTG